MEERVFSPPYHGNSASLARKESIPTGTSGPADQTKGLASPSTPESKSQLHKGTQRKLGNQLGILPVRLVRTWV
jgi:hypothetical protein